VARWRQRSRPTELKAFAPVAQSAERTHCRLQVLRRMAMQPNWRLWSPKSLLLSHQQPAQMPPQVPQMGWQRPRVRHRPGQLR
jgi:hypothetical protein